MCANHAFSGFYRLRSSKGYIYLLVIFLGIAAGYSPFLFLHELGAVISDVFIRVFQCISLPIISLSIIVTLARQNEEPRMRRIWRRVLYYTLLTTLIAAFIACVLYSLISPPNIQKNLLTVDQPLKNLTQGHYLSYLASLIPTSILAPFVEHQVIGVLIISAALGFAVSFIPDKQAQQSMIHFFKGAHGIFMTLTSWVIKVIPLGLFGFIIVTVVQLQHGAKIGGLAKYLLIIALANLVQGLVVLPAFLFFHGVKPFQALSAMLPALSVAFFSKSSTGTLPVTMSVIEGRLGVSAQTSRSILPLCTTVNMNGCAAFIFTTVVYLMQNSGIEITFLTMVVWVFIATVAAIGNAGVPMGCFFLSASLLTSMNVPIELLGLILPFYSLIDMLETALNVWSDSCVTKVIDQKHSKEAFEVPLA